MQSLDILIGSGWNEIVIVHTVVVLLCQFVGIDLTNLSQH